MCNVVSHPQLHISVKSQRPLRPGCQNYVFKSVFVLVSISGKSWVLPKLVKRIAGASTQVVRLLFEVMTQVSK